FPVECDDLDLDRLMASGGYGLGRIQAMGADPGNASEEEDHQRRYGPDNELETSRVDKVGPVTGPLVRGAIPPRYRKRGHYGWNDDREHDRQRVEKDLALGTAYRTGRVEYAAGTAAAQQGESRHSRTADGASLT